MVPNNSISLCSPITGKVVTEPASRTQLSGPLDLSRSSFDDLFKDPYVKCVLSAANFMSRRTPSPRPSEEDKAFRIIFFNLLVLAKALAPVAGNPPGGIASSCVKALQNSLDAAWDFLRCPEKNTKKDSLNSRANLQISELDSDSRMVFKDFTPPVGSKTPNFRQLHIFLAFGENLQIFTEAWSSTQRKCPAGEGATNINKAVAVFNEVFLSYRQVVQSYSSSKEEEVSGEISSSNVGVKRAEWILTGYKEWVDVATEDERFVSIVQRCWVPPAPPRVFDISEEVDELMTNCTALRQHHVVEEQRLVREGGTFRDVPRSVDIPGPFHVSLQCRKEDSVDHPVDGSGALEENTRKQQKTAEIVGAGNVTTQEKEEEVAVVNVEELDEEESVGKAQEEEMLHENNTLADVIKQPDSTIVVNSEKNGTAQQCRSSQATKPYVPMTMEQILQADKALRLREEIQAQVSQLLEDAKISARAKLGLPKAMGKDTQEESFAPGSTNTATSMTNLFVGDSCIHTNGLHAKLGGGQHHRVTHLEQVLVTVDGCDASGEESIIIRNDDRMSKEEATTIPSLFMRGVKVIEDAVATAVEVVKSAYRTVTRWFSCACAAVK